jgi:2,4-dienoyl-CoA reductase-like NADH-dependent reductase (Old Yellow Enzyme family)
MTAAVGLIVHAEHAEEILTKGQADLVGIAREHIYNPNWSIDAAQELRVDPDYSLVAGGFGRWLARRRAAVEHFSHHIPEER